MKNWNVLSKVIDIVKIFTRNEYLNIFHWIPEYDIRIVMNMSNFDDLRIVDEYERLLKGYKNDKNSPDYAKLDFYMNYLSLLNEGCSFRFVQSTF